MKEYYRPNFWPNTPDINPFHLQGANESKYMQRYALAATLSSNIGIYGPVFEQMISDALLGKEEYLNSEKFQICNYNWEINNNLIRIITKINKIRQEQEALQQTNNIKFCTIENDQLMGFYKWNDSKTNELLIVISLDDYHTQQGTIQLPLHDLGLHHGQGIEVEDLLTGNSYHWNSEWNFVQLHPSLPIHIFRINK
jgi:starch synthase (maltosyl-transferring)